MASPAEQEPVLSVPNLLTLVRLPMAGAVWWLGGEVAWLIGLMVAAAITDMLDGWFARRMRARREALGLPTRNLAGAEGRGAWLDPLCDKVFVLSVIGTAWIYYQPAWWLVTLVATREILLVPVTAVYLLTSQTRKRGHLDVRAGFGGKLTTVVQFLALWAILLESSYGLGLALGAAFAGLLATLDYTIRAFLARTESPNDNARP